MNNVFDIMLAVDINQDFHLSDEEVNDLIQKLKSINQRLTIVFKEVSKKITNTGLRPENIIKYAKGFDIVISKNEKMELISKISTHKLRKQFFIGTGCNSLNENIELIKYASEFNFNTILLMPSAYFYAQVNTC